MSTLSLEERNALAAQYFPKLWADAQAPGKKNGTKRTQLRNAAEHKQIEDELRLRAQGASCATCRSFGQTNLVGEKRYVCSADCDFYGYAITTPGRLCHRWMSAQPGPAERDGEKENG